MDSSFEATLDALWTARETAITCNALARDFIRHFGLTFSTDCWCAEQQAREALHMAETMADRMREVLGQWDRLPRLYDALFEIKLAYSDRLAPITVRGTSCTTAHEAAAEVLSVCLQTWLSVDGESARQRFDAAADALGELAVSDLYGLIEAEYFSAVSAIDRQCSEDRKAESREVLPGTNPRKPKYQPPPCPLCGEKARVTSKQRSVRYLKCSKCGHTWPSTK
jgi:hypothetical protein